MRTILGFICILLYIYAGAAIGAYFGDYRIAAAVPFILALIVSSSSH